MAIWLTLLQSDEVQELSQERTYVVLPLILILFNFGQSHLILSVRPSSLVIPSNFISKLV